MIALTLGDVVLIGVALIAAAIGALVGYFFGLTQGGQP